jgi:hypothetical protein
MNRKALIARWKTATGQAQADEVIACLIAGRPFNDLGLDEHEGRVDLRSCRLLSLDGSSASRRWAGSSRSSVTS